MSLTQSELAQLAINFPKLHKDQIDAKAAKYKEPRGDVSQGISLLILQKGKEFDATKGTLEQFIFGHWEKQMRRQTGAHTFAVSLDRDDILGEGARTLTENMTAPSYDDSEEVPFLCDEADVAKILAIARVISGKSTSEIAQLLGVTPRRVRQMLQQLREKKTIPERFESLLNLGSLDKKYAALKGEGKKVLAIRIPTGPLFRRNATQLSVSAASSRRLGL